MAWEVTSVNSPVPITPPTWPVGVRVRSAGAAQELEVVRGQSDVPSPGSRVMMLPLSRVSRAIWEVLRGVHADAA